MRIAAAAMLAASLSAGAAHADAYGALAYSQSKEAWGYAQNFPSREAAEADAMSRCAPYAPDCRIAVWFANGCAALALGDGDGWGAAWDASQSRAQLTALNSCKQYTRNCALKLSFCSK